MTLPLAQHLSILGHALVTIAIYRLPQEAAELHVARVRVDAVRGAFDDGARMLHDHVKEHFSIAILRTNRARLADLVKKDIEKFTLDLRRVWMCAAMAGRTPRQWVLSRPSRGRFGPASARIYPAVA